MGTFITIEGIEGSGKSTLIRGLAAVLESWGHEVVCTREPGATEIGRALRSILLKAVDPAPGTLTEVFLFAADRAQHVAEVIRPALAAGKVVLCDRYTDSTLAYQGGGRGVDRGLLETMNELATSGLKPERVLLLDLDPETGLRRARNRCEQEGTGESWTRFEAEELAFHQRLRDCFLALAASEPGRFQIIDATRSPEELVASAMDGILALLDVSRP
ncbi:MAG: dTMP kinase [Verrucomicrobia bacterium]|nr:dTMP kinase [Verrucomicrobiota bacterium]MDA1004858.1 dTMP kinase [Verrucomicrobiota bacterium]